MEAAGDNFLVMFLTGIHRGYRLNKACVFVAFSLLILPLWL